MANHASALKAHRQNVEQRNRNREYRSRLRKALKTIRQALADGRTDEARSALSGTVSLIDKLVSKGVIHDNAAGRYKSRLMKRLSAAATPSA